VDIVIGNTSEIAAAAARLEIDFGFIEGPCHEQDVQALPWLDDELVIVCGPAHPLLHEDRTARVGVKALREQRWLLREPGSGTREAVENALLPHLNQWKRLMVLGSTEAIKQAVAVGLGIACLPLCAVRELLALRRISVIKTTLPRLTRPFYQVHHRQKQFSSALEHFVTHCRGIR
jgi:DNA-binding transcriptional LysR family regulator